MQKPSDQDSVRRKAKGDWLKEALSRLNPGMLDDAKSSERKIKAPYPAITPCDEGGIGQETRPNLHALELRLAIDRSGKRVRDATRPACARSRSLASKTPTRRLPRLNVGSDTWFGSSES